MANTTAIASGVKRYFAGPVSSTTGVKTRQIESVETNAGAATCLRAVQNGTHEWLALAHIAMGIFDLNGCIVDQNADCERHAAKRHHVDRLPAGIQHDQ